jgi:hypothetical protein
VLHPVAHLSNWFLVMQSIATKFQYVNSFLFSFTHYMFRTLRAIFRWDIQLDVFKENKKGGVTYWNSVAIDGITRNQFIIWLMEGTGMLLFLIAFRWVLSLYTLLTENSPSVGRPRIVRGTRQLGYLRLPYI